MVSKIRSCAGKLGGGGEIYESQRTAKRYDDGHGKYVAVRLLLLAAVLMAARALPPLIEQTSNDKEKRHRAKILAALRRVRIRISAVYFNLLTLEALCRAQGVGSVSSFSAQPDSTMKLA